MIITLKNTTSAEVASRIVELRDERGSAALSRVLTLLICAVSYTHLTLPTTSRV